MKTKLLFFAFSFWFLNAYGQEEKKQTGEKSCGIGIEEGVGYNTCFSSLVGPRTAFWIQPCARVYYSLQLRELSSGKKIKLPIFLGYYTFGGARTNLIYFPEDPQSKEILLFRSIEAGVNPCLDFKKLQVGLLFKGEYIFSVLDGTYGDPIWRNGHSMEEDNVTKNGYKNYGMNVGAKLKYKIKKFSVGAEAWWGVTNLYDHMDGTKLTENNYRLMLGYEF